MANPDRPRTRVLLDPKPLPHGHKRRVRLTGCPGGTRCKKHPGVMVIPRPGDHFQLRWTDASGHAESESCERLGLRTAEARCEAARRRLSTLQEERKALTLSGGGAPADLTIDKAVSEFVATARTEGKAERTILTHLDRLAPFQDWAKASGVGRVARLTLAHLKAFRKHVLTLEARRKKKGEGRKAKGTQTGRLLSGQRQKAILKATAGLLRECAPHLSSDAVTREFATRKIKSVDRPIVILKDVGEVRQTLNAALEYDAANKTLVAPLVLAGLLAGLRGMDIENVRWEMFESDARDPQSIDHGRHGVIRIPAWSTKKLARTVGLGVSPALKKLLLALKLRAGDADLMFGVSEDRQQFLMKRLRQQGAPPTFSWRALRRTCQSVSFSAATGLYPGGFWHPLKRLGHSLAVAEKHYATTFPGLDPDATTLEGAMKIRNLAEKIIATVQPAASKQRVG